MTLHVLPPHHVAEELSRSQVSDLHALPRSPVQSEAVQARVQLFHLCTLMFSGLYAQNQRTYFMHQRSFTQMLWGRGVNYSATLHFAMRNSR